MENEEYTLTEDELGMLNMIQQEMNQVIQEYNNRANLLLSSIIKYRKLPTGMWTRQGNKVIKKGPHQLQPPPLQPPPPPTPTVN
jgi:hypothetical protein